MAQLHQELGLDEGVCRFCLGRPSCTAVRDPAERSGPAKLPEIPTRQCHHPINTVGKLGVRQGDQKDEDEHQVNEEDGVGKFVDVVDPEHP